MGFKIAVIGATGAVGKPMLKILESRRFPVSELVPFASSRSEGKPLPFKDRQVKCRKLEPGCFLGIDLAFFDASDAVSKEWVPHAAQAGAWVIDNSATNRMDPEIPLVVPEINANALSTKNRIIAGPNCTTVQLVLTLKPILENWGLRRVVVSSYQSVSGAGNAAIVELRSQTQAVLEERPLEKKVFPHSIAFNCIPQIGSFKASGYTSEEQKIMEETRKILSIPGLKITATAVRVPTFYAHGESVNIECERPFELTLLKQALGRQAGIQLVDEPECNRYPLVIDSAGHDPVYVGRIRGDDSVDNGLNLWIVSDNLRKGAALNAVQIGEALVNSGLLRDRS